MLCQFFDQRLHREGDLLLCVGAGVEKAQACFVVWDRRVDHRLDVDASLEEYLRKAPLSLCSMICLASSIIPRTISPAGLISFTNPTLSPAMRAISSKSPVASGVGGRAENFGSGTCLPERIVCPMSSPGSGG